MSQRIRSWVERACERLDERMCALANLTDDGEDEVLGPRLAPGLGDRFAA